MKRALKIIGIVIVVLVLMVVLISIGYDATEESRPRRGAPQCDNVRRDLLTAQSVPGAQLVPCVSEAEGWKIATETYSNDGTAIVLANQSAEGVSWDVNFTVGCQPLSTEVVNGPAGATVYQQTLDVPEADDGTKQVQWMVFPGGCVVSTVVVPGRVDLQYTLDDVDQLLKLVTRAALNDDVKGLTDDQLQLDPS